MRVEDNAVNDSEEDYDRTKAAKGDPQILEKIEIVLGLSDSKHSQPSSEKSTRLIT